VTDQDRGPEPPDEKKVRLALRTFGDLVRRLDDEERLLDAVPLLLARLGDLRQMLFSYEVLVTERLLPTDDPVERESRDIVRRAREREREMLEEWEGGWTAEDDPDEG
jgi:hypothetical protein